jgi:hypothetical protein
MGVPAYVLSMFEELGKKEKATPRANCVGSRHAFGQRYIAISGNQHVRQVLTLTKSTCHFFLCIATDRAHFGGWTAFFIGTERFCEHDLHRIPMLAMYYGMI